MVFPVDFPLGPSDVGLPSDGLEGRRRSENSVADITKRAEFSECEMKSDIKLAIPTWIPHMLAMGRLSMQLDVYLSISLPHCDVKERWLGHAISERVGVRRVAADEQRQMTKPWI